LCYTTCCVTEEPALGADCPGRAYHDHALIDEFQRRGIDTSAVYDGKAISFAHPVRYDLPGNRLVAVA